MFTSRCKYLLVLIYLLCSIKSAFSIHCYSCDTIDDHEICEDPFNTTLVQPVMCMNDNFACVKQLRFDKDLNRTFLQRGCVQKHYCELFAKSTDVCSTCTYDYCNSASTFQLSTTVFITFIISFILLNRKQFGLNF